MLATLPAALLADEGDIVTISLLHTTDLHGHILPTVDYNDNPDLGGLARCATQIRRWQNANPHNVLLDIGDLYQGTEVGLQTRGEVMIHCLNALAFDAWVIGNHDFDWGMEALADALKFSSMPVLSGNALIEGRAVRKAPETPGSFSRLKPYFIKEMAGFRIAIVGLTTPALTTWIPPENLRGFEALDPVEALCPLLRELEAREHPDAIVLAGHMGLTRRDDYANRVGALTREFPQLTVFLGGHTHQNHSSEMINNVLYTQADHYGIYAGKVDLTFDLKSRRLLRREALTVQMDRQIPLDPRVLSLTQTELAEADMALAHPVGELTETFGVNSVLGEPSDIERLIASGMKAALHKRGVEVDAVVHGLFDERHAFTAGVKTVGDIWTVLPYENEIATVDLSRDELFALVADFSSGAEFRNVMGLRAIGTMEGKRFTLTDLHAADGSPLTSKASYRVAMNSYDSQSAGQRFSTVARLVARPANHRVLYPIHVRDALIDFFVSRQTVSKSSLLL
jgi:2',3'-cyclic-nucleotide 2'-phosphodiesterase/3'-nucleotidase